MSWVNSLAYLVIGGVMSLLTLTLFAGGGAVWGIASVVVAAMWVLLAVRRGVRIEEDGLALVSGWHTRRVPWRDVIEIRTKDSPLTGVTGQVVRRRGRTLPLPGIYAANRHPGGIPEFDRIRAAWQATVEEDHAS